MIPPFRELNVWGIYERDDRARVVKSDRVVEVGSLLGSSVSDEWAAVNRRHLFLAEQCIGSAAEGSNWVNPRKKEESGFCDAGFQRLVHFVLIR